MNKQVMTINAKRARRRVINGSTNRPMRVEGNIRIINDEKITHISDHLRECQILSLVNCRNLVSLPQNLKVDELILDGCVSLQHLPENLDARRISARGTGLVSIPDNVNVVDELNLAGCTHLTELPENLSVTYLVLSGCPSLEELPDGLVVSHLDVSGCTSLMSLGKHGELVHCQLTGQSVSGHLNWDMRSFYPRTVNLRDCPHLTEIPDWMQLITRLDVSNSPNLTQLPQDLRIVEWVELAESGLSFLPPESQDAVIRWNGVGISEMVAFRPDKISARMVLNESNVESRRVMLERMGYRRFFDQLDPDLIDMDEDAGGERMLLSVRANRWWFGEPIVCLAVSCPSTQHRYMLRVPPTMQTCHQAAAWLAGFDDPKLYKPLVEA